MFALLSASSGAFAAALPDQNRWLGIADDWGELEPWMMQPKGDAAAPRPKRQPFWGHDKEMPSSKQGRDGKLMVDGIPFVFHNPDTNKTAVICVNEKCGSSTWKGAFYNVLQPFVKSRGEQLVPLAGLLEMPPRHFNASGIPESYPTLSEALANPDTPRIIMVLFIVRVPFIFQILHLRSEFLLQSSSILLGCSDMLQRRHADLMFHTLHLTI